MLLGPKKKHVPVCWRPYNTSLFGEVGHIGFWLFPILTCLNSVSENISKFVRSCWCCLIAVSSIANKSTLCVTSSPLLVFILLNMSKQTWYMKDTLISFSFFYHCCSIITESILEDARKWLVLKCIMSFNGMFTLSCHSWHFMAGRHLALFICVFWSFFTSQIPNRHCIHALNKI